jgi:hypothetical protein
MYFLITGIDMVTKIDQFVENLESFVTLHPVFSIFIGLMFVILIGLVIWAMVLSCICMCAKYPCCKRNVYYVNKKSNARPTSPPPPPPTPVASSKIDPEKRKKEEQHPLVERAERATRQQVTGCVT